MGQQSYQYSYATTWYVPSDVKCAYVITVGGGGGGGGPSSHPGWGRGDWGQSGGSSSISGFGVSSTGGGGGGHYSGGAGGTSNWRNGQAGWINYSGNRTTQRAASGYPPSGYGGSGQHGDGRSAGGGGGGASCCSKSRDASGLVPGSNHYVAVGGPGTQGGSGYRRFGDRGRVYICVCTYDQPSANLTITPTSIIGGSGDSATLCWTAGGDYTTTMLETSNSAASQVSASDSSVVSPSYTTTYTFSVSNPAYTQTAQVTLTVYIPPDVSISAVGNQTEMIQGDQDGIELIWNVTGDADTATLSYSGVSQGVALNSQQVFFPSVTTTYTLYASGLGGADSDEYMVTVLPPPTITVVAANSIDWEDPLLISFSATHVDPAGTGITVTASYFDGTNTVSQSPVVVPNSTGDIVNIVDWVLPITWDDDLPAPFGPRIINLTATADGYANLTDSDIAGIFIDIDETPTFLEIPATDDALKDQDPVITPGSTVTTTLEIDDIDIPVKIKSDYPIQVEIEDDDIWRDIQQM